MRKAFFLFLISSLLIFACENDSTENNTTNMDTESTQDNKHTEDLKEEKMVSEDTVSTTVRDSVSQIKENDLKQSAIPEEETLNPASAEKKGNVYEFYQAFNQSRENGAYLGEKLELDLSNTSGGMLSAYSLFKSEYAVFYRVLENNEWSNWNELPENKEVNNPKRKVFEPVRLESSVSQIQFKSNNKTDQDVVFRIFTFAKK